MSMANQVEEVALDQSQYRLIGAVVWLVLLVVIVPVWYSNPVNFKPNSFDTFNNTEVSIVNSPFVLPKQVITEEMVTKPLVVPEKDTPQKLLDKPLNKAKSLAEREENKVFQEEIIAPTWIIRLVAYRNKEMAEEMKANLKYDYDVSIRYFPATGYYSLRIGPYQSKDQAKRDQVELDHLLRIQSELVKIQTP